MELQDVFCNQESDWTLKNGKRKLQIHVKTHFVSYLKKKTLKFTFNTNQIVERKWSYVHITVISFSQTWSVQLIRILISSNHISNASLDQCKNTLDVLILCNRLDTRILWVIKSLLKVLCRQDRNKQFQVQLHVSGLLINPCW